MIHIKSQESTSAFSTWVMTSLAVRVLLTEREAATWEQTPKRILLGKWACSATRHLWELWQGKKWERIIANLENKTPWFIGEDDLNSGQTRGRPCGSTPATQHPDFVPAISPKGLNTSLDQCPKGTFNQLRCLAYKSYSLCITQICPHLFEEKKDMSTLVQNVIEKK